MASLLKVSRTEIVVENNDSFDEEKIRTLFQEKCGDRIATMRIAYEEGSVRLLLYPFKNYAVFNDVQLPKGVNPEVAWIRRLQMVGTFPKSEPNFPTSTDVVERYWKPIRKGRSNLSVLTDEGKWRELTKAECDDLGHIIMYVLGSKNLDSGDHELVTEMEFISDFRLHHEKEGMTADERVAHMLNLATKLLAEALRHVISDINPSHLEAARMLDELSQDFADALEATEVDDIQEKYNHMGLRYVDNDARVCDDNHLETDN